jgi:hypothetical protein
MPVLVNKDTRVICQGITGSFGAIHTKGCHLYGTKMVGGVTPGKGGTKDDNGLPIFDTVEQAVKATGANATMIFVPPPFAADAILEAAAAGLNVICAITEGVPVQDMIKARAQLDDMNAAAALDPAQKSKFAHGHRPQLPRRDHAWSQDWRRRERQRSVHQRRLQDRHHARLHPHPHQPVQTR